MSEKERKKLKDLTLLGFGNIGIIHLVPHFGKERTFEMDADW
jgi:hypothetical protein